MAATYNRNIYFLPNSGNAGDALINTGFYAAAQEAALDYEEISADFNFHKIGENDLLILSGGGEALSLIGTALAKTYKSSQDTISHYY